MTSHRRALLLALVALPLLVRVTPGCGDGPPPEPLRLSDASQGCAGEDGGLTRPVARGARLDLAVRQGGAARTPTSADSSDPSVLEVLELTEVVTLAARTVGTADVTVGAAGKTATAALSVAPITSSSLRVSELSLWPFDTELVPVGGDLPARLAPAGLGLLPGGEVRLDVTLFDAAQQALLGYGAAAPAADPPLVTLEAAETRKDDLLVRPTAGALGETTISVAGGATVALTLVPTGATERLDVWVPDRDAVTTAVTLPAGETVAIVVLAYAADGRLLFGDDGAPLTATLADPAVARLRDPPWAEENGGSLDQAGRETLARARVLHLEGLTPGTTTLALTLAGAATTLTVTVAP